MATNPTLTPEQADALARDYFERLVRADERRLCHFQPEDEADMRRELARVRREAEGCRELLRINDWPVAGELVDRLLAEAGLEATVGDTAYRDLCRKVFRALTEAARLQGRKLHGDYGVEPRDPLFKARATPSRDADPGRPAKLAEGAPPGPRLSAKTLNRHASALSGLFAWAKKHGHWAGESPAAGFVDKRAAAGGEGPRRRPWRPEELERLFASPVWAGCAGAARRSTPGREVIRDARYYAPLIGLCMGLRLEEIAKLRAEDLRRDGGLWAVDVVGNEAGRVKEDSSNRTVPVHPVLIKLGFIDHVEAVRARGGGAGSTASSGWG